MPSQVTVLSAAAPPAGFDAIRRSLSPAALPMTTLVHATELGGAWHHAVPGDGPRLDTPGWQMRHVAMDDAELDGALNIVAKPLIHFVTHMLWDVANAPDIRNHERSAFDAYRALSRKLVASLPDRALRDPVIVIGEELLLAPTSVRERAPDAEITLVLSTAWCDPQGWEIVPHDLRTELFAGMLASDRVCFASRRDARRFLACCRDLFGLEVEADAAALTVRWGGRMCRVSADPPPVDTAALARTSASQAVQAAEEDLLASRRQYLIACIAEVDPAMNLLRNLSAFDLFLEQQPDVQGLVTFAIFADPVSTQVHEFAEYLERLEALVAVANHRHGTSDWMPILLRLGADEAELLAYAKSCDIVVANPIRQGLTPAVDTTAAVNERGVVPVISMHAGVHERLGEHCLAVNPFDIQELANAYLRGITMPGDEREVGASRLREIVQRQSPAEWVARIATPLAIT
jgi:trehalose 6-phosphate synthase